MALWDSKANLTLTLRIGEEILIWKGELGQLFMVVATLMRLPF